MGDERAHPEFGREGHRGAVVRFGHRHVGTNMMRGNLAKEAEGPRLIAALTALAGEQHGAVGAGSGVLDPVREQVCLAELHDADRVEESHPRGLVGGQGLLQPGDALRDASRPHAHVPERRHTHRSQVRDVPIPALSDRAFE